MKLQSHDLVLIFIALSLLLLVAKLFGGIARRLGQAPVLGELIAGIFLGPTVLGWLAPEIFSELFPRTTPGAAFFHGFQQIAVVLFLLVAGLEIHLKSVVKHSRVSLPVSLAGIVVPFIIGYLASRLIGGEGVIGPNASGNRLIFDLFFATALSISALPVIARILLDLKLYDSDIGIVTMSAAVFNDLAGWLIFAFVLSIASVGGAGHSIGFSIVATLLFTLFMILLARPWIDRLFAIVRKGAGWPSSALWITTVIGLLSAAFTEWIGVHALFGAFLAGVALGDSDHLDDRAREPLDRFVMSVLAPIFFATIGLRVDFVRNFDLNLVVVVLVVASIGKILGCAGAAKLARMPASRAWAVGFAMNARGAMEIVLGLLALDAGLIGERMFVALVIMALATSLMSGPMLRYLMKTR